VCDIGTSGNGAVLTPTADKILHNDRPHKIMHHRPLWLLKV